MLAFERGSEEVATNVRAFREGALCGPVKWLLVVDHFTLRRFKHSAYMYCLYIFNGVTGAKSFVVIIFCVDFAFNACIYLSDVGFVHMSKYASAPIL
jgi:hypothetical protein